MKKFINFLVIFFVASFVLTTASTGFASETSAKEPTKAELEKEYSELKQKLNEHMDLMHKQMDEIKATKDPEKRQKLMREHEWAMYESMELMEELGGYTELPEQRESGDFAAIDERLDYMEKIMVQMMRHLAAQNIYVK